MLVNWLTGYWSTGYTGTVATYSAAGTYTIEKMDSWGDGGFGVQVGAVLGSFTGILTGDAFNLVDKWPNWEKWCDCKWSTPINDMLLL